MTMNEPVITVTLNPAIDQTLDIPGFAAGQVNRVASTRIDAGGKGVNVASNLADLRVRVTATGFLGADNAAVFESLFREKKIEDRFVRLPGATRVGIKIVDDRTHQTTDINFPGLTPTREQITRLLHEIESLAMAGRWFVLSGSVPIGVPHDTYARMIRLIRGRGGCVALDTSGEPLRLGLAGGPDVVKPNVDELSELVGRRLESIDEIQHAAEKLLGGGVELVAVSMGGDGALFVSADEAIRTRPPRVTPRSTVGAGDAMVSGIVYARLHRMTLADTARTATALGAYAVARIGAGIDDMSAFHALVHDVVIDPSPQPFTSIPHV